MVLLSVEKKAIYQHSQFQELQKEHHEHAREKLVAAAEEVIEIMASIYKIFEADSEEVQREWVRYTNKVDKKLEDAVRHMVKRSLQDLSRLLNGDKKTEVQPLFHATIVLEGKREKEADIKLKVEMQPSIQVLLNTVLFVSRNIITVSQAVPRVALQYTEKQRKDWEDAGVQLPKPLPSIHDVIHHEEDTVLKNFVQITSGIQDIIGKVEMFLLYWERKYQEPLWKVDKEGFIRRYEKASYALTRFDADILKYLQLQEEVQLATQPATMDQLANLVNLHARLMDERKKMEARFEPLREKYKVLARHEVQVPEEQLERLDALNPAWTQDNRSSKRGKRKCISPQCLSLAGTVENMSFCTQCMSMGRGCLTGSRVKHLGIEVKSLLDTFLKDVSIAAEEFTHTAPYSHENTTTLKAFATIEESKNTVKDFKRRANELKSGMEIFSIPQPAYKELANMEKEIEQLDRVWSLIREWQTLYGTWKDGAFVDIEVEQMEEAAGRIGKAISKLGREVKTWPALTWIKETVEAFKKTMPLITDLRNPAMRQRHWEDLMDHVHARFDPNSSSFTLETLVDLRLDQHTDFIADLSINATKELSIENSIKAIAASWKSLPLDMVEYKSTCKLRSTEDIFAVLEENSVMLSTMKASKFFVVFESEITYWEKTLSHISETIEIILQVQRNWMYLENIFIGSEDIRKQLPQESIMFENVHNTFSRLMKQLASIQNCLKACTTQGLLETFQDMDTKLEKIQKSLENYLESKRQQFPRFYFLSSSDLLEILGQARDPLNVQPHLKKCFEGIKKLEMVLPGDNERKQYLSMGITAQDGEQLPFMNPVVTEGRPEEWLNRIEDAMFATTKKHLYKVLEECKVTKKEKWVKDSQGQMIITAGQIIWTHECEKALADADSARRAVKALKKKWISYLNKLTLITRSKLTKIERGKVVALITIEVHARDVIDKLSKANCTSANDFEWVSQLRFYWDKDLNDCVVKQVLSVFVYGYEYQGNNGRLVITPLTDRCYMTLGAAMFTRRGGNPLGPAGTGKTETVKDFGKALARYVIVFNCSDGVDYKMTGKMFSGLAQTGAWTCLDEFNRIEVEVLSVVATQIATVMHAIKEGRKRFIFLGQDIRLIPTCGIFVTMNPGYAGRSELPDNLKAILRPVSMMVPDFSLIAEIMMFAEGFSSAKVLAKKMIAIMELSQQQLSKQDHYDYGLRSFVIPIARGAGFLKRVDPEALEEVILYRTMLDLIKPKLVYLDLPLFMALLSDLFPGVELPPVQDSVLIRAIIQIFDCKVARHGNMIVGRTGSGKSTAWKTLTRAMARLKKDEVQDERFQKVQVHTVNPLALSNDELYGAFEESTHEWHDGVLARIFRTVCKDESPDQKWILFDGPVDTLWIESMNTTLDDNKLLTLLSGERIAMPPQVSLLFEVEDLSQASPATVSRAGMIYLNVEDLGWRPYITSWLNKKTVPGMVDMLVKLIDKYMESCLEYKRLNCRELVPTDRLSCVRTFTRLFDSLATPEHGVAPEDGQEAFTTLLEKIYASQLTQMWFLFCMIWGLGGTLDEDGRKKFDTFMREKDARYPSADTVFEYCVDPKQRQWVTWESKLSSAYRPPPETPFFKILVPTIDTVRNSFVASSLVRNFNHTLVVGNVGVGKTMIIQSMLDNLPSDRASMVINFSAQTSSNSLQDTIEGRLEKRTKGVFAPAGGKKLVAFIDDLNMPQKSKFGFIPPLELLKLWVDNGFWYDRHRCELKHIKDMQLLAGMAPPGGGRNPFSARIMACFSTINVTAPNNAQLKRIFGTILNAKLADFDDEATRTFCNSRDEVLQLWCHETCRVISDRMWDKQDKDWLEKQLDDQLQSLFSTSLPTLFETLGGTIPPFVNFMRGDVDVPPYEPVRDMGALKDLVGERLQEYGEEPGHTGMDLVLFRDALLHICRVHRILQQPRGNALLVGVGGSGRKSLSRLATFVAELKCFTIEITRNYRQVEFREDLKGLYRQAGCANKPTVFLFDETQIVNESFLEDVNNILSSGELYSFFLERVRTNLHVILCLSPVGETFRERCRMFPGLVNCTTIDWFTEWPADALFEVASKQLEGEDLGSEEVKNSVCKVFVTAHQSVEVTSKKMLAELKRHNYVTATNYLETVRGYRRLLREKRLELGDKACKLKGGLHKLDETSVQVASMKGVAEEKKVVVAQAKTDCEELLVEIVQVQAELDKALPALQAAEEALNVLTKKDMSELKAYAKPPALVELTLNAVMTVFRRPATWEESKKQLGDPSFMNRMMEFDKDKLDDALLKKIGKFTTNPSFTADAVGKVSVAARGLCLWVHAMDTYGHVAKDVAPKRAKLKAAQDNLAKKQSALAAAQEALAGVLAKVQTLKDRYDESTGRKRALEEELSDLEGKLERAEKLVTGLAGERIRCAGFSKQHCSDPFVFWKHCSGLHLRGPLAALNPVVLGRSSLCQICCVRGHCSVMPRHRLVKALNIPASENFDFSMFLADPKAVRDWNIQGLPSDSFSTENGVMVTRGTRWPLMIDPQGQANKWVKNMEGKHGLKVLNLQMSDMVRQMEMALAAGSPVLLQDVEEEMDPILEPVLSKSFVRRGNSAVIKLGDKEADLEDTILALLSSATGSLLDNITLINTLDASKTTWEEVNQSLKVAEETARKIEAASQAYRPCSIRAAVLYFVLNDLGSVDPMYQFSLDAYNEVFAASLKLSPKAETLPERIKALNDYHTYSVYKYTARGLFERHKLLLSLQMCMRILQSANQINLEEWQFFLKGGTVLDRSQQPNNPSPLWISEEAWDNVTELENLANFKGIVSSMESSNGEWERWYRQEEPETAELPSEWESKCNELQRLLLVRCLRPDRVIFCATSYVANSIGRKFVEPPVLDLGETYQDSSPTSPLIFVLSPGVDPTDNLRKLAQERGMANNFFSVALGQGQAQLATRLIEDGMREGNWVFLANCHLMTSWLPTLDKIIEGFEGRSPHENFRLWLSSNPSPSFPIAILQRGLKMTTEPPKGLRANLLRLYNTLTEEGYSQCKAASKYQKLVFALSYFHSVLLERRKFRTLGLNIPYDFNDTDFSVSDDLLKTYLDSYERTPWDALKYLIAEANYGGRVTDELDRRVLNSYLNKFYCEEALTTPNYPLSPLPTYYIPDNSALQSFKDYISTLPATDRPEAFGQHPNAEISYLIEDSKVLLDTLLGLQPRVGGSTGAGASREDLVMSIATDLLEQVRREVERNNGLLSLVRRNCAELQRGIKGLVVMSADLDEVFDALYDAKVPAAWLKTYPSLKPLGPWTRDLLTRIEQLAKWIQDTYPRVYWLPGFTYPTGKLPHAYANGKLDGEGFLTAVLQTKARKSQVPIDTLSFEFTIINLDEAEITAPPREGVYGGGWDFEAGCLTEPEPMELIVPMPIILFKPVENKKRSLKGFYSCPLYMYPVRTGTRERPSFQILVDLRAGSADADHWIMRGTALLLSLAS
ncbi:dynein-1-beta heavy chain, flagellar inner arm I1 complex [Dunaliella salina]|uniref:Dynein-1-beta heavy chain, flagellar inner arm I1 complex n=1 Tax=Dunaliella salina TaxID=3046 RepID=A0ABQ7G9B9_DUNSA|nr:dynein-1-beta heavy chain, flagellar inner arm I1 complex [Dunaliella salina]|eukprot:KAF5831208.1 dynein-1-beta heavy chain, flagellar inner arm I1 complex [Dunaliella salina]